MWCCGFFLISLVFGYLLGSTMCYCFAHDTGGETVTNNGYTGYGGVNTVTYIVNHTKRTI